MQTISYYECSVCGGRRGQAGEGWGWGAGRPGQTSEEVKEQTLQMGEGRTFRDHKTLEAAAERAIPKIRD